MIKMKKEPIDDRQQQEQGRIDGLQLRKYQNRFVEWFITQINSIKQQQQKVLRQNNTKKSSVSHNVNGLNQIEFGIKLIKLLVCLEYVQSLKNKEKSQNNQDRLLVIRPIIHQVLDQLKRKIQITDRINQIQQQLSHLQQYPSCQNNRQQQESVNVSHRIGHQINNEARLIDKGESLPKDKSYLSDAVQQQPRATYPYRYSHTDYNQLMSMQRYQYQLMMGQPQTAFMNNQTQQGINFQLNPNQSANFNSFQGFQTPQNPTLYTYYPQYAQQYPSNSNLYNSNNANNQLYSNACLNQFPIIYSSAYTQLAYNYPYQNFYLRPNSQQTNPP